MPGLAPQSLRQPLPTPANSDLPEIQIEFADDTPQDTPVLDDRGNVLQIEHGDGSISISLDGEPIEKAPDKADSTDWFRNLAEDMPDSVLAGIADDLLRGIENDNISRQDWLETRATGLKLLGLKVEVPNLQGGSDGAPLEGMSKVRHPLLLEAVLRFQANARSELLPTDGPVKVRNDALNNDAAKDQMADALELDLNHYLTAIATEYYPDTDRMLFQLGFGGTEFKKVYNCPLRQRPVSETVDAPDLIVNDAATDLANAKRITHNIMMRPSIVKRMQLLGFYRDIPLGQADAPKADAVKQEVKSQEGIAPTTANPDDRDRQIYECYCEWDLAGFPHKFKGKETGLEIPYRVTIDVSSRSILAIVRNYDEDDQDLPQARQVFVKYAYVPGPGFWDIGLVHILGNSTNALTAAWRELLDAGMYANFPGFLIAKNGTRQNTNQFRVPPGGGAQIDTGGQPLKDSVMPLPYKEPSQALMLLVENIADTGARLGGTSESAVGEGNAETPVGTALAHIEQATKIQNAVHKRNHAAQADEFKLLVQCFRENPESFWRRPCKSRTKWDEQMLLKVLNDYELVPQADPNTASHGQRVMKIQGLMMMAQADPQLFNKVNIATAAIQALGWNNPQQFLATPEEQAEPTPEVQQALAEIQVKDKAAEAQMVQAQAKKTEVDAKMQSGAYAPKPANQPGLGAAPQIDTEVDKQLAQAKLMEANTKDKALEIDHQDTIMQDQSRDADRESEERIATLGLARDVMKIKSDEKADKAIVEAKRADSSLRAKTARMKPAAKPKASK